MSLAAFAKSRTRADAVRRRRLARAAATGETVVLPAPTRAPERRESRAEKRGPKRRPMPGAKSRYERAFPWPDVEVALPALPAIHADWRMASLTIVLLLVGLLFSLNGPQYFVEAINLSGAVNVPGSEVYEASGVDRQHILWVDPKVVKVNVEKLPGIASAEVEVRWPNVINVGVVEREPVLSWQQGGQSNWVDRGGIFFPARSDIQGLLPVIVDDAQTPLAEGQTVPVEAIEGALQLRALRPNVELLHYDALNGLSYQDGRGWRGYFGVGANMQVKLAVYETLVANLLSRSVHPTVVSVSNPDAPFYRR
ncbi:MAG: FtsQ-type POTRA domain-containing protein [Chloroflexi bacterium]|nr:FtsQ-type POTRA domain-containing protein [Chloroflexota bacterium]